jgi:hypothetical protein
MRGLLISLAIIFFCVSVEIVNTVEANFITANHRPLFGWTVEAPITSGDLPDASEFNNTMGDFTTPQEQPAGLSLQSLFATGIFLWKAGWWIIRTLFFSTLGFFWWIQTLGRSDFTFVPAYLAVPISGFVYSVYLFTIYQWWSERNLRDGA